MDQPARGAESRATSNAQDNGAPPCVDLPTEASPFRLTPRAVTIPTTDMTASAINQLAFLIGSLIHQQHQSPGQQIESQQHSPVLSANEKSEQGNALVSSGMANQDQPTAYQQQNQSKTAFQSASTRCYLNALNASRLSQPSQPSRHQQQPLSQYRLSDTAQSSLGGVSPSILASLGVLAVPRPPAERPAARGSRDPVPVYMDIDRDSLSEYQCLLRQQIELFEATMDDVQWNAQGRNKAIVLGQVGIRCRHCSQLPIWSRPRGAVYYSATLDGLYQAGQNMSKNHLCKHCNRISPNLRGKLMGLRDCKRRAAGGKKYWAEGAKVLGVVETADGLRFRSYQNTSSQSSSTLASNPG